MSFIVLLLACTYSWHAGTTATSPMACRQDWDFQAGLGLVGRTGTSRQDQDFSRGDRDFSHGDRDFSHGDQDFSHGDRDFSHGDRDFSHGDRDFSHGDRDFSHRWDCECVWRGGLISIKEKSPQRLGETPSTDMVSGPTLDWPHLYIHMCLRLCKR